MSVMSSKPHALLVPSPGMGHLISLLEVATCLATHHNFHATVLVVSSNTSPALSQVIQSAKSRKLLGIIELPAPSGHDTNAAGSVFTHLPAIMRDVRPSLQSAISAMERKPSAMIVDLFGTAALTVAEEFRMLKYVTVASAWTLSLLLYAPILDKQIEGEYLDQKELLNIPGCKPVRPEDVVKPMMNRKDREYESFIRIGKEITSVSDGILINTWEDLEPTCLEAMREHPDWKQITKVPLYTIGPMVRLAGQSGGGGPRNELLDWLDKQPRESVLYISFGSGGVLSAEQITEMAWGLELSKQRFIWVVQPPSKGGAQGNDISEYLPEGFMARTHDKGLVVTTWAPQSEILTHAAVGGFLSHCGWNSALESILNGLPMIAWPLYAEQKMVATLLVEELKVAIRPKVLPTKALAGREEIEMLVRKITEQKDGDAMRARAKELKASGEKALCVGGSSFNMLSELSRLCKINTEQQCRTVGTDQILV
ncbi:putative anthocyanidin 3-O-glucosyltransferase [Rosa chinensis]|uniref:Glycosyltransferase n=1 Tax=Rosa chinensis TaxID=74649 RepID=A0A2P6RMM9_ROSCH|nr:anthocyanidin 3-O-glucosyltransferase 5 [Rosa chinensis]PRQ47674.1 putative anthocyanidin 3-O-glucosyltransferase [Rosa chinensis]